MFKRYRQPPRQYDSPVAELDSRQELMLRMREAREPAVYAPARVYQSLANPGIDQITLDHLTDRAAGIARSEQLAPAREAPSRR